MARATRPHPPLHTNTVTCPPFPPSPVLMSTQPLLQRTANKRIALPVRVEPKVAFANERTFLSWLHFTVILGGLAVGLLNFGDQVIVVFVLLSSIPFFLQRKYVTG